MDKLLPRIASRSLIVMTSSSPSSSCAFARTALNSQSRVISPKKTLIVFSRNDIDFLHRFPSPRDYSSSTTPKPTMEKSSKDARDQEAIKDQQREGYAKSACDYDPSNRAFDQILPHILNIYGSRGTAQDFEIYAPDATFEDPLMRAQGVKQIKSAFYSIPKVFSESRIVEYSIKENVISPGNKEILMDNKQYYKFLGKDITMISLIKLQLKDGKIIRHEDLWDKKPLKTRETVQLPLVGRIMELTRRGSMLATHALMGFGKDPAAST